MSKCVCVREREGGESRVGGRLGFTHYFFLTNFGHTQARESLYKRYIGIREKKITD